MDIYREATELFPYLEGAFLDKPYTLTMGNVESEMLPDHKGNPAKKYILTFKETAKKLVLNKTNTKRIVELYGRETNAWAGQKVTVYAEDVRAFGETHRAVRVRKPDNGNGKPASQDAPPMPQQAAIDAVSEAEPESYYNQE